MRKLLSFKSLDELNHKQIWLLRWYMSNPICGPFRYEVEYDKQFETYTVYQDIRKKEKKDG